jgi:hypothetical protein
MKPQMLPLVAVLSVAALAAPSARGDEPEKTFRNVTVSVPKLKKAPVIDGAVDDGEWKEAGMAPRQILIRETEGDDRLTDEEKHLWWGWTDDALYLAFRLQMPHGMPPAASVTTPDRSFWQKDDGIEVHFCNIPGRSRGTAYTKDYLFCWNLLGTKYDRVEHPVNNLGWNPEWEVKCRYVPGYGWEGEARWPFKIFEFTPAPKPGDLWTYNFIENSVTPRSHLTFSAFSTMWSSPRDFGNLLFRGPDDVYARPLDTGVMRKENRQGVVLEVVNPGAKPQKADMAIKLYRRKDEAGAKPSYLRAFDQSRDRPEDLAGRGKAPLFLSDDKVAEMILKESYELKKEIKETAALAPGERKKMEAILGPEPGTYVAMYDVSQGDGPKDRKVVAGAALPFVFPEPLGLKILNSVLVDQSVQAQAELAYIPNWTGKGTLEARVAPAAGDAKALFEKKWAGEKFESEFKFDVGIKGWKPGNYRLQVVARGPDGAELAKKEAAIAIPEIPAWFTKKAGLEPVIPPPFTPIQLTKSGGVDFLMGAYEFKGSVLPSRILVRSVHERERKDLLRGPIQIKVRVNGKEGALEGEAKPRGAKPELVEFESFARFEGLEVRAVGAIEYDDMEKVTLKVAPSAGATASVEDLWIEVPMRTEYSDLAVGLGEAPGLGPWAVPKEGAKVPFREVVTIGDEERRFSWFTENWRGWKIDPRVAKETVEFVREADGAVTLKIHLIRVPGGFKVEKEREIVFGLIVTPTKPLRPEPIHQGIYGKDVAMLERSVKEFGLRTAEHWAFYLQANGEDFQGWPEMPSKDLLKGRLERMAKAHAAGAKILPYTGWFINRKAGVYPVFGAEMVSIPAVDVGCGCDACCWNTPVQDVFDALLAERVGECHVDGFRMDAGFVDLHRCSSLKHRGYGSVCGWVDDDGKLQGSLPIFAARKAAERAYRIFHGGAHKDGICIQARSPCKSPVFWSFFDAALCSEGMDTKIRTLKELPLEFYRTVQMGDAYGVQLVYMPKSDVTGMNSRLGISAIHGDPPRGSSIPDDEVSYSRSALNSMALWKLAGDWMKYPSDPKTEFWGYWKNSKFAQTSGEDLKASFYVRRGERLLLAAMNLERKAVEGAVKLDLAALGFKEAFAQDALTGEDLTVAQGALKLDFLPEGYRLVRVTAAKPSPGVPQATGEDLFAAASPEKWPAGGLAPGWSGDAKLVKPAGGELELAPGVSLTTVARLDPAKRYMVEVEARVECDDGVYLGPQITKDCFRVMAQGGGRRWIRTMSSQDLPGRYETLRLVLDAPLDAMSLQMTLEGKGKVCVRALRFRAIQPFTRLLDRP